MKQTPPRYCNERTLPEQPYIPGTSVPRPAPSHWVSSPWNGDANSLHSQPNFRWGADLYNNGFFWEAHEAWEELWRQTDRASAAGHLLQGLIQLTGAALKAFTSQPGACRRLAEKGSAHLLEFLRAHRGSPLEFDVPSFVATFRTFAADTTNASPPQLVLASFTTTDDV